MHDDQAAHLFSNLGRELERFVASLPIGLIREIQTYKIGIMILMPKNVIFMKQKNRWIPMNVENVPCSQFELE